MTTNNLHRELAPVSEQAWAAIEQETTRTLKRYLAGRRVVDVHGPDGPALSAVGTGHQAAIDGPADGVHAWRREVLPLVELRAPFALSREQIDDVLRGAEDSDWQPAKEAARLIAQAEDRAIFGGYDAAGISGIGAAASNPAVALPGEVKDYPNAVATAIGELRAVGVDGPYAVVLSADAYTAVSETSDHGYPVIEHIRKLIDGDLVWAPAISGAFVLSTRGGDFSLHLGADLSIGYLSHTDTVVRLYLQETFTFRVLTSEAAVALTGGS